MRASVLARGAKTGPPSRKELIAVRLSVEGGNVPSRPLKNYHHGLHLVRDEQKEVRGVGGLMRNTGLFSYLESMGTREKSSKIAKAKEK